MSGWHQQPVWRPYQGFTGSDRDMLGEGSDHLFLLRKGIPVHTLSFDVEAESISNMLAEPRRVGKGYDAGIPAVFKAKVPALQSDTIVSRMCTYFGLLLAVEHDTI